MAQPGAGEFHPLGMQPPKQQGEMNPADLMAKLEPPKINKDDQVKKGEGATRDNSVPLGDFQALQRRFDDLDKKYKALEAVQAAKREDKSSDHSKTAKSIPLEYGERIPIMGLSKNALNSALRRMSTENLKPSALGFSKEKEKPNIIQRLAARFPFLAMFTPTAFDKVPLGTIDAAGKMQYAANVTDFYTKMQTAKGAVDIGNVALASKEMVMSTISPALSIGAIGAVGQGVYEGVRAAVFKDKTADVLARAYLHRGTDGRKSWDQKALWKIVFGDRSSTKRLLDLGETANIEDLMMDKSDMRKLIRRAFAQKMDSVVLERILPPEIKERFNEAERIELQDINSAYEKARDIFERALDPVERAEFLDKELPDYLSRREITNHIKAVVAKSAITGFKTSLVGSAVSLFKSLSATSLLADWGSRTESFLVEGAKSTRDTISGWFDIAKKNIGYYAQRLDNFFLKPAVAAVGP